MEKEKFVKPDYIIRMEQELAELNERIVKANVAVITLSFHKARQLEERIEAMCAYRVALRDRIDSAILHESREYGWPEEEEEDNGEA